MTRSSARNFARGDYSRHRSGIFVGKITAVSDGKKRVLGFNVDVEWILHTGGDEYHHGNPDDQRDMLATRLRRRIEHRIRNIPTAHHKDT